MTGYEVTAEIKRRADRVGVYVLPSKNAAKKLDAFDKKSGVFQASFGGHGYMDFLLYKRDHGLAYARQKRQHYKRRHERDRHIKYRDGRLTAGYLADQILW